MKRRGGALRRKTERTSAKAKSIIFCEGANTEPDYLKAFRANFPRSLFEISLIPGAGVPHTLLKRAILEKKRINSRGRKGDSFEANDVVWIVFDRDEHPNVAQTLHNARDNGIETAYSNPCFELWLILHQQDFDRPDDRKEVQRECEKCVAGYSRVKGKSGDFSQLVKSVEVAEQRAEVLCQRREDEDAAMEAPSTTFYRLTRQLRGS